MAARSARRSGLSRAQDRRPAQPGPARPPAGPTGPALAAYDAALGGLQAQVSAGVQAADAAQASQDAAAGGPGRADRTAPRDLHGRRPARGLRLAARRRAPRRTWRCGWRPPSGWSPVPTPTSPQAAQAAARRPTGRSRQRHSGSARAMLYADDVTARADAVDRLVRAGPGRAGAPVGPGPRAGPSRGWPRRRGSRPQCGPRGRAASARWASRRATCRCTGARRSTCPGMQWTLLAAVGQVESGHGRNNGPSSAGAIGPMQFRPQTFAGVRGRRQPRRPARPVEPGRRDLHRGAFPLPRAAPGPPSGVQQRCCTTTMPSGTSTWSSPSSRRIAAAY